MDNLIVWAAVPATDLERAMAFYAAVLQHPFITIESMPGIALPGPEEPGTAAASDPARPVLFNLYVAERIDPEAQGCTVYLNGAGDAEALMRRAVAAGGEVITPMADMGETVGAIGFFRDSEGNRIGVHRPPAA